MSIGSADAVKKFEIVRVLEQICQALELTAAQHELAKGRYEAIGEWLGGADNGLLRSVAVYPQGSVALGTTVRPLEREEHDVDLICHVLNAGPDLPPAVLKRAIGERLQESHHYKDILEEMPRCWRLNYANEFHLDITPSIRNPNCRAGGELVPDKTLKQWKASNPKGHRRLFEERALLQPRLRLQRAVLAEDARADVEPFPARSGMKGMLRRAVQLEKRHRDIYFQDLDPCLRPISIIITTLAAKSYAYCATHFEYDSELDFLRDVVRLMPDFIEERLVQGSKQWFIWNETTAGENFAEKWNADASRAEAFFEWHDHVTTDLTKIASVAGFDELTKSLKESFGEMPTSKVMRDITEQISSARRSGYLSVVPVVGLTISSTHGATVRPNTFFGRE